MGSIMCKSLESTQEKLLPGHGLCTLVMGAWYDCYFVAAGTSLVIDV